MFCNNCGKELVDESRFCAGCGIKIEETLEVAQESNAIKNDVYENRLSTLSMAILSILALLFPIIGLIAWLYNRKIPNREQQAITVGKFAIAGVVFGIVMRLLMQ